MMDASLKSTIIGMYLVLLSAVSGGIGISVILVKPFDYVSSVIIGIAFILGSIVCWGWACFARKELYT
jgi:hypothetical protein